MKRFRIIFFLLFSFLISSGQDIRSNRLFIENYGLISDTRVNYGRFWEIEIHDNIAYIGTDAGLAIYDLSDINNYELIGFHKASKTTTIHVVEDKIYIASKNGCIAILDIKSPGNPELIFTYELQSGNIANEIKVEGNYIFVFYDHLTVIDISDYANPIIIDYPSIGFINEMVVNGNFMYASGSNFRIFNITDISNITEISSIYAPGMDIELVNNYIYTTGSSLKTIDVSDPGNPTLIKQTFFTNNVSQQIEIIDDTVYVSGVVNDDGLFAILNIINPEEPEIIVEYNEFLGRYLFVNDSKAYFCTRTYDYGQEGLKTLNIHDYNNVELLNFTISSTAMKCRVYDKVVFLANGYSGFNILDISNIWNPNVISEVSTKWRAVDLLKDLNVLYVAQADSGIQIFNIEDLSNPVLLSEHCTNNSWDGYLKLDKYQGYLYTAGLSDINEIIDVSDPNNPVLVGSIPTNDWGPDIQILNDHLFLAGYWGGFQIFSLTDPVNPIEIGYYPLDLALKITVSNQLAFIYDNDNILIFDISNIANPQLITTFDPGQYNVVFDMFASGDTLYYSDQTQINILDVSNPNNPVVVDSIINTKAISFDLYEDNFFTNNDYYLRIYGDTTITSTEYKMDNKVNYCLIQNYPNPCSNSTNFEIYLPRNNFATLEILDAKGQIVKTVFDCNLTKGRHEFVCNIEDISPSLYFYKLNVCGNLIETKKLIISK